MHAALVGVDGVGEGVDGVVVLAGPLQRDVDLGHPLIRVLLGVGEGDDAVVHLGLLGGVEVADEVAEPAFGVELHAPGAAVLLDVSLTLILHADAQASGQEGRLAEPRAERLPVVVDLLEDLLVGPERDRGAGPLTLHERSNLADRGLWDAAAVGLGPQVAVATDLSDQARGEGVDDRHADAVETP